MDGRNKTLLFLPPHKALDGQRGKGAQGDTTIHCRTPELASSPAVPPVTDEATQTPLMSETATATPELDNGGPMDKGRQARPARSHDSRAGWCAR